MTLVVENSRKKIGIAKRNALYKVIKQIYYDYCANTSIHCLQYLGEARSLKEKLFWMSVFVISVYTCTDLIQNVYTKWNETPVIVSFSEKSTPVWTIPFPAVTICSETKRRPKSNGFNYADIFALLIENADSTKKYKVANLTSVELDEFRTLLQICNTQIIERSLPHLSWKPIDYFEILDKMLPSFKRHFFFCKWFSYVGECDKLFTKTYTEEGICFSFNGLNRMDLYRNDTYQYYHAQQIMSSIKQNTGISNHSLAWSLQRGYQAQSGIKTYPARVLGAGSRAGLFIALQSFKQEIDYGCRGPIQGFKVLLHSPDDIPFVSQQYVRIPMGKEVQIAVKPNMITTSDGIAGYHPHRRQCFLNGEHMLRFFKVYTQSNCELECLTNFTLHQCGCVKFSMPRDIYTPVCSEQKIHCYNAAENDLLLREFNEGLEDSGLNRRGVTKCNCLPACTSLVYNTEISQGNFDLEKMLQATRDTRFLQEFPGSQMSRLSIYFKENQFITSKRSELFGVTDFLANCGGIFGLFMGFSILSMVELLYHVSLRLWFNINTLAKV